MCVCALRCARGDTAGEVNRVPAVGSRRAVRLLALQSIRIWAKNKMRFVGMLCGSFKCLGLVSALCCEAGC